MGDSINLIGDDGVNKTVLRHAKPHAVGPLEDLPLVDVHYEGTLAETGEVFDTTHEDNTVFSFEVGTGSVIKAWDISLKTMKVGEVAKIVCKPEYAYGSAGSPPDIPPNATLVFEVELLACKPRKGSSMSSVSEERARLDELKKQRELRKRRRSEKKPKQLLLRACKPSLNQRKVQEKGREKGSRVAAPCITVTCMIPLTVRCYEQLFVA